MAKKITFLFFFILLFHGAIAQDEKMINVSIIGGITPNLYNSVANPISIVVHADYNITDNISAGLFYQLSSGMTKLVIESTDASNNEVSDFSATAISQIGAAGMYRYNTSGTFLRPFAMLTVGMTSVQQSIDQTNDPFNQLSQLGYEDFSQHIKVDNSYFTVGLGLGVEIKLIRSFGATIQVIHYDVFGLIGDEAQLIASTRDGEIRYDVTNGYLSTNTPILKQKYIPIYFNAGIFVKFLKKKI